MENRTERGGRLAARFADPGDEEVLVPPTGRLVLLTIRRTMGLALVLFGFYLFAYYAWRLPFLAPGEVVAIVAVVFVGTWLGVAFSRVWPLPPSPGRERVFRTALLTVPALGFGIAIQVFLVGPDAGRAYYMVFALAAWLGSGFIRREATDDSAESESERPDGV